ncbi:MBL fold metallo-hydrolase [Saccharopolyspora elongata]|uniref:MBL fold metallo-hydrolase n=1 Tax=Saccharopolyspora elongata TaxID=2530387 RepID=A0A4R4YA30_9PSEU|nr:MBL fold metallo-hydrolase [Saccharopolyspora elongata]TDD41266.1 MBL fold metallo-hydrolase [Saccharopolyspora elongata]
MCDIVSEALRAGISRRSMLAALGAGAAALGTSAAASPQAGASARSAVAEQYRTRVVLLGTAGGPPWWNGSKRSGISTAVVVGDRYYVVDAGHGVGQRIREARLGNWKDDEQGPLDAMRAIFLTHLHSDHVSDLNNLLLPANGRQANPEPVQVWGPGNRGQLPPLFGPPPAPAVTAPENPTPGTVELVDLLTRAFATDYNDRAFDNRKPPAAEMFTAHDVPIPAEYTGDPNGNPHPRMSPVPFYEDDRVRVSATLVKHAPVFPALAFRFDTDDGSVVLAGDTARSENLIEMATGADVLVHEVMEAKWLETFLPPPRNDVQEGLFQHLLSSHTTVEEVGPIADEAGVATLVLSHLAPAAWPEEEWRRAGDNFSGTLVIGHDLDETGVGTPS